MYNIIFFLLVSCFMNSCANDSSYLKMNIKKTVILDDSYNYCNFIKKGN